MGSLWRNTTGYLDLSVKKGRFRWAFHVQIGLKIVNPFNLSISKVF